MLVLADCGLSSDRVEGVFSSAIGGIGTGSAGGGIGASFGASDNVMADTSCPVLSTVDSKPKLSLPDVVWCRSLPMLDAYVASALFSACGMDPPSWLD